MTEINGATRLATLAEQPPANWWAEEAPTRSELELPTRVLKALEDQGILTVEQLKAAGPAKLRKIDNIGKLGFSQIVNLLRALDRQTNGVSHDHEQGQAGMR